MTILTLRLLAALVALAPAVASAQTTASAAPPADASPEAAQVLRAEGETMLVRGASFSTPVRPDVPIRSGDRIRTGADGRVQLRFADGALISIAPGTDFRVEQWSLAPDRPRSFFRLVTGSVRAVSGSIGKRDRDAWRLTTPTATIGIRGTEFVVDEAVCPAGGCPAGVEPGLTVSVIAGRVAVTNRGGTVEVPAGATLRVRDAATAPVLAGAPRRAAGGAAAGGGPERLGVTPHRYAGPSAPADVAGSPTR